MDEAQKRGMGIIAVTHNRHLAERIATRTVEMANLQEERTVYGSD